MFASPMGLLFAATLYTMQLKLIHYDNLLESWPVLLQMSPISRINILILILSVQAIENGKKERKE